MNPLPSIPCRFVAFLLVSLSACSSAIDDFTTAPTGGTSTGATGGTSNGGTSPQTGGTPSSTGGLPNTGGTTPSTGGIVSQGGTAGGLANTGGQLGQGGSVSNGGTFGQGGTLSNGGSPSTGGFFNGGAGGSGGKSGQNGGSSSGGAGGNASSGSSSGGFTTAGAATGSTGGDPFGGASLCTSKTTWRSGENQNMRPGEACIACHATNKGPDFNIAGTVYPTGHEPNDCNGKGGVTIVVTDAKGTVRNITVNSVGNFNFTGTLSMPYTAKVTTSAGASRAMLSPQNSGDCNSCHTEKGANGAPGRIVAP